MIDPQNITGLILAGGRGSRMGGVDKGLQNFRGLPLAMHAMMRLSHQVGTVLINANRNLSAYESMGASVWPDALPDFAGPLAGFLTGLEQAETEFLAVCPVDSPLFPTDYVAMLGEAMLHGNADIAVACAPEPTDAGGHALRAQPVFCLLRTHLLDSLVAFTHGGGRKIDAWTALHASVQVPFERSSDTLAFANVNTLSELHQLEES